MPFAQADHLSVVANDMIHPLLQPLMTIAFHGSKTMPRPINNTESWLRFGAHSKFLGQSWMIRAEFRTVEKHVAAALILSLLGPNPHRLIKDTVCDPRIFMKQRQASLVEQRQVGHDETRANRLTSRFCRAEGDCTQPPAGYRTERKRKRN